MIKRPFAVCGFFILLILNLIMGTRGKAAIYVFALLLLASLLLLWFKKYKLSRLFAVFTALTVLCTLWLGFFDLTYLSGVKPYAGQSAVITGTVTQQIKENAYTVKTTTVNGVDKALKCTVYFSSAPPLETDTVIRASVQFYELNNEASPFYFHTASSGVILTAYSYSAPEITLPQDYSLRYYVQSLRTRLNDILTRSLSERSLMLVKALLLGDTSDFTKSFQTQLQKSGASHIFAVSGMHLSVWTGIFYFLFRKRSKTRWLPSLLLTGLILFYVVLVKLSPSVIRAAVMLLTVLWGAVFQKRADSLNSLGIACTLLLCVNPFMAGNVSFLLSVFATASMFVLYPHVEKTLRAKKLRKLLQKHLLILKNSVMLSLCVLLFTLPLSAYFFGTVSLLSPVSSILCTLPAEGIMLTSFLGLLFSFLPKISTGIFFCCECLCTVLQALLSFISELDFGVTGVSVLPSCLWLIFLLAVFTVTYLLNKKRILPAVTAVLSALILSLGALGILTAVQAGNTYITAASAGNASSFVISTRLGGKAALLGTGSGDYSGYSVFDTLQKQTVYRLDYLLIPAVTDTENKHTSTVLEQYSAEHIITPPNNPKTAGAQGEYTANCYQMLLWEGATYENLCTDDSRIGLLEVNGVKIVFCFYPATDFSKLDSRFQSADLLYCRAALPLNISTQQFTQIVVFSHKTASVLHLPSNAVSTVDVGKPTLTVKRNSDYRLTFS